MKCILKFFFSFLLVFLCSCQSNPTYDTFTTLLPWTKQYSQVKPGYEYILVSANGRQAVMALGNRVSNQQLGSKSSVHEYWYTGAGEMLVLLDGRISKALGFTHEIRSQTYVAPSWVEVVESKNELSWLKKIDLMPGFRYNLQNNVTTYKIAFPKDAPKFVPLNAEWITDLVESKALDGRAWSYLQRFAILDGIVFYSEQCIDKDLCLTIRRLGVVVPAK
jgi:hypothetical protein